MTRHLRLLLLIVLGAFVPAAVSAQFKNFISARGDSLMDGEAKFRFISFNIPNLAYIEDYLPFTEPDPWRTADSFEIHDALEAIRQAGGRVVRMYTMSVRKETDDSSIVRHVTGLRQYNEAAFRAYDTVLAEANKLGVRVIIPFIDNWWWWGGPKEFARFRGMKASDFWTDSLLISDYQDLVAHLVNRVNTVTGIPYRDDKAILCWETGNELECPTQWNVAAAAFIKSLDHHHLVMAGAYERLISEEYLADPNIDIVETHHYDRPDRIVDYIRVNRALAMTRKPYIVGEFGFVPTSDMKTILDTVIADETSGIMVWSMRQHSRDGGFYYHQNSYRWPGFPSGAAWDELAVDSLFHAEACRINGEPITPLPTPATPTLLPIKTPFKISWQGSTGATSYIVERREQGSDTSWRVISSHASDAIARYRPLFEDTSVVVGSSYLYRVRAQNASGVSDPSQPVGPVAVAERYLIDDMKDSSLWFSQEGELHFLTLQQVSRAKEDADRVAGSTGSSIIYRIGSAIAGAQVEVFATTHDSAIVMTISSGPSPDSFALRETRRAIYPNLPNEYRSYTPVVFTCTSFPAGDRFVKVTLADNSEIGRIEITYERHPDARIKINSR